MPTRSLSRRPGPAQARSPPAGRRARPAQAWLSCASAMCMNFELGDVPSLETEVLSASLSLSASAFDVPASGRLYPASRRQEAGEEV